MKKVIFFIVSVLFASNIFAQQDPQFSLNMFNHATLNPGYAGTNGAICASAINRMQWMGFNQGEGNPKTMAFNVNMPLSQFSSGAGLTVFNDNLGFEKNFGINLSYAYILEDIGVSGSKLGLGLSLGMYNKSIDGTWVTPSSLNPSTAAQQNPYSDPAIPLTEAKTVFDMGFGAFYRTNDLYVGISTTHLLQSKFKFTNPKVPQLRRHYYLSAGYYIKLPNPQFELRPSIFVKTDATTTQFSINARVIYNKQPWAGLSYRVGDAIIVMAGYTTSNNIRIGLAYDITTSTMGKYSNGSLEFVLGYCFNASKGHSRSSYGSVRFL